MSSPGSDTLSKVRIEPTSPIIRTKQAAKEVNGHHVEVLVMGYSDRIMVNVTMEGKIGQLVSIALSNPLPIPMPDLADDEEDGIEDTPSHLNPRFLLGSANDPRGEIAQLYAVQIASLVVKQSPQERRTLLVGVGLKGSLASDYESDDARELIQEVLEMVNCCSIW